jgi:hypothetical protein
MYSGVNFAQRCGAYMSRAELMDAAIKKLDEVGTLLTAAGEDRLAADAAELADWVGFSAIPLGGMVASVRGSSH